MSVLSDYCTTYVTIFHQLKCILSMYFLLDVLNENYKTHRGCDFLFYLLCMPARACMCWEYRFMYLQLRIICHSYMFRCETKIILQCFFIVELARKFLLQ